MFNSVFSVRAGRRSNSGGYIAHPLQPSDTSSPAATLDSLIDSCNELQNLVVLGAVVEECEAEVLPITERILDCLDLSELPTELRDTAGIQSAMFLKEVLDRIDLPNSADIPAVESEEPESPLRWRIPINLIDRLMLV